MKGELSVRDGPDKVRHRTAAGSLAAIRHGIAAESKLDPAKLERRSAWRSNLIDLGGTTLAQAIEEFNRYRATPLVISDPRIAAPVAGVSASPKPTCSCRSCRAAMASAPLKAATAR